MNLLHCTVFVLIKGQIIYKKVTMSKKQQSPLDTDKFKKLLGAISSCLKTLKRPLKRIQNCNIIKTVSRLVLIVDKFSAVHRRKTESVL